MNHYDGYWIEKLAIIENDGQITSQSATAAAEAVTVKEERDNISVLILVTQQGDFLFPGTSFLVHRSLGLSQNCMVYDINLASEGFLAAIEIAIGLLLPYGTTSKGIVIAAEHGRAAAALIGFQEGCGAKFYHYTYPDKWNITWGDRWSDSFEISKPAFLQVIEECRDVFQKDMEGEETDLMAAPQFDISEENFSDSPVLLPFYIAEKGKDCPVEQIKSSCFACGSGCSVVEACLCINKEGIKS